MIRSIFLRRQKDEAASFARAQQVPATARIARETRAATLLFAAAETRRMTVPAMSRRMDAERARDRRPKQCGQWKGDEL